MDTATLIIVPAVISVAAVYGIYKRVDVFDALVCGAYEAMKILAKILPSVVCLLSAIYALRASGLFELLATWLAPVTETVGVPSECMPLMLIRPLSGSGALGIGADIMRSCGADSYIGRVAAVMLGSSESTFYTIAVYFGSLGIKKTRYAIPAALIADIAGYLASVLAVKLLL